MKVFCDIVLLVIAIEAITYAILNAGLFDKLRTLLKDSCNFLNELLSCGYCFSFWVSLNVLVCFNVNIDPDLNLIEGCPSYVNFLLSWIILHRLSNILHGAIDKYFDKDKDRRYINIFTEE